MKVLNYLLNSIKFNRIRYFSCLRVKSFQRIPNFVSHRLLYSLFRFRSGLCSGFLKLDRFLRNLILLNGLYLSCFVKLFGKTMNGQRLTVGRSYHTVKFLIIHHYRNARTCGNRGNSSSNHYLHLFRRIYRSGFTFTILNLLHEFTYANYKVVSVLKCDKGCVQFRIDSLHLARLILVPSGSYYNFITF